MSDRDFITSLSIAFLVRRWEDVGLMLDNDANHVSSGVINDV